MNRKLLIGVAVGWLLATLVSPRDVLGRLKK